MEQLWAHLESHCVCSFLRKPSGEAEKMPGKARRQDKGLVFEKLLEDQTNLSLVDWGALLPPEVAPQWDMHVSAQLRFEALDAFYVGQSRLAREGELFWLLVDVGPAAEAVRCLWRVSEARLLRRVGVEVLFAGEGHLWAAVPVSPRAFDSDNLCGTVRRRTAAHSVASIVALILKSGLPTASLKSVDDLLFDDCRCMEAPLLLGWPPCDDAAASLTQLHGIVATLLGCWDVGSVTAEELCSALNHHDCFVCGQPSANSEAVACSAGHVLCEPCLWRCAASEREGAAMGDLKCPFGHCSLQAADLVAHVPRDTYGQMLQRHALARGHCTAHWQARRVWRRVYSGVCSEEDPQGQVLKAYVEERVLPDACPGCGQEYHGFDGCAALTCVACGQSFCAWCHSGPMSSQVCHDHVLHCIWKSETTEAGPHYAAEDAVRRVRAELKRNMLEAVLDEAHRSDLTRELVARVPDVDLLQ
jgi:hypothetical protein